MIHHLVRCGLFLKRQKMMYFSKRAHSMICSTPKLPCLAAKEPFEFRNRTLKLLYKSSNRDVRNLGIWSTLKQPYLPATHCNTLQRTVTHCNALQRTVTQHHIFEASLNSPIVLQHTATHCNTLQHSTITKLYNATGRRNPLFLFVAIFFSLSRYFLSKPPAPHQMFSFC